DRLGERVGPLEHHADAPPHLDRVDVGSVERCAVVVHGALAPGARDQVVHAVQAPQDRRLAAARRPDERGDLVLAHLQRHVPDRPEVAVEGVQVGDLEHDGELVDARLRLRAQHHARGERRAALERRGAGGLAHDDLFFSKRLRRTIAIELINRTNTSIARIVAEALASRKPGSGCLAQVVTMVGRATNRSPRRPGSSTLARSNPAPWVKNPVTEPTTMRGAASPTARATDSSAPVMMPGAA